MYFQTPTYDKIFNTLYVVKDRPIAKNIQSIVMPKFACGLDKMDWGKVSKIIVDVFQHSGIASGQVITETLALEILYLENVSEIFEPICSDLVKVCKKEIEIASDFSHDVKNLCRPPLKEKSEKY